MTGDALNNGEINAYFETCSNLSVRPAPSRTMAINCSCKVYRWFPNATPTQGTHSVNACHFIQPKSRSCHPAHASIHLAAQGTLKKQLFNIQKINKLQYVR